MQLESQIPPRGDVAGSICDRVDALAPPDVFRTEPRVFNVILNACYADRLPLEIQTNV